MLFRSLLLKALQLRYYFLLQLSVLESGVDLQDLPCIKQRFLVLLLCLVDMQTVPEWLGVLRIALDGLAELTFSHHFLVDFVVGNPEVVVVDGQLCLLLRGTNINS